MSSSSQPAVSVVVPVFNGEATIGACIQSILQVDFPSSEMELIVVNNRSTDATLQRLELFRGSIRIVEETKLGPAAARNAGVHAARGRFIVFTDADCVVERTWLRNLLPLLDDTRIGIAGGAILAIDPANRIAHFGERIHDHRRSIEEFKPPYAITMNWASRRAVLSEVGLFDESLLRGEDVELSWRIHAAGYRFVYCDGARVRHHNESTYSGLLKEGCLHGRAAIWVRDKMSCLPDYGTYSGLRTGKRILQNVKRFANGPQRFEALCWMIFDAGKLLGQASLVGRRPQLERAASDSKRYNEDVT